MATNNKYDRQLRLWGANGQKALAESCMVLINATSAGTETLKNLVLPGIGSFHIIDDQKVECQRSNGNGNGNGKNQQPFSNFFVFPDQNEGDEKKTNGAVGRAEIATRHLLELNPDVKGSFTSVPSLQSADYKSIFQSIRDSNKDANLIVATADLPPSILRPIADLCWSGGDGNSKPIPLVIVKSYGLLGTVRIQTPLHTIIESKPDNSIPDLRLAALALSSLSENDGDTNPNNIFPELLKFIQSIDLSSLEKHIHGHVPFVIILYKAMEKWFTTRNTDTQTPPQTFTEKQEFKQLIQSMSMDYNMELNFQEAVKNASLVYATMELPCQVEEMLSNAEENLKNKVDKTTFDILLVALKQFMNENRGLPPLNGRIPDMTASTSYYIQLQNIYKTKAQHDLDEMKKIVQSIVGVDNDLPSVTDEELSTFCKNVYNLRLTKTRSYSSEYDFIYSSDEEKEEVQGELASETFDPYSDPAQTPLLWTIALRAADAFHDEYGHYPGNDSRALALESDAKIVQKKIKDIVEKMGLNDNELITSTMFSTEEEMEHAYAKEIVRYNNAEIHNIASIVGGVASQEAVKLITKQYVPMNGTYIYNGIAGVPGMYIF